MHKYLPFLISLKVQYNRLDNVIDSEIYNVIAPKTFITAMKSAMSNLLKLSGFFCVVVMNHIIGEKAKSKTEKTYVEIRHLLFSINLSDRFNYF